MSSSSPHPHDPRHPPPCQTAGSTPPTPCPQFPEPPGCCQSHPRAAPSHQSPDLAEPPTPSPHPPDRELNYPSSDSELTHSHSPTASCPCRSTPQTPCVPTRPTCNSASQLRHQPQTPRSTKSESETPPAPAEYTAAAESNPAASLRGSPYTRHTQSSRTAAS